MATPWPETLDALSGKRVLVVGDAAENDELRAVLRLAGARVMASTDVDIALTILARFAIEVVIADPALRAWRGEAFSTVVQHTRGPGAGARVLELPALPTAVTLRPVPSVAG